jgi:hypothetical protein
MMSMNQGQALRLTVGELAFAVSQIHSYEKAVKLISTQFEVERVEDALLVIQASGQSLHARELATQLEPTVELAPPLVAIGRVFSTAEWMLRCSRTYPGGDTSSLLLHLSSAGVLAHEVVTDHVQQIAPLASLGALLGRAADLFRLPHVEDTLPSLRLPRDVFEAVWSSDDAAAIEALLEQTRAPGVAGLVRSGLAEDLASPLWKGGISKTHYPKGQEPTTSACLYLAAGQRTWLADPDSPISVVITLATRQRFADVAMHAIEHIPAGDRRFA